MGGELYYTTYGGGSKPPFVLADIFQTKNHTKVLVEAILRLQLVETTTLGWE